MKTLRCTSCAAEFSDEEVVGHSSCPACNSPSIPCLIAQDITLDINWQELRVLCNWAANWASKEGFPAHSRATLNNIIARVEQKHRKDGWPPLTLFGEVKEIPGAQLIQDGKVTAEGGKVN